MHFTSLRVSVWAGVLLFLTTSSANSALWVTGYYPGYKQCDDRQVAGMPTSCDPGNDGTRELMPPSALDFSTLTHVIHFALIPGLNVVTNEPALDEEQLKISPDFSEQLIKAAHAANRKVLLSVGGANTGTGLYNQNDPASHLSKQVHGGFRAATDSPAHIASLVNALVNFMQSRHYDGIDVDWEPICVPSKHKNCMPDDSAAFTAFITQLRAKLNTLAPQCTEKPTRMLPCPLLTVALEKHLPQLITPLQAHFDQINVMTYDLGGAWFTNNWMTWFHSPLYNRNTFITNQTYQLRLPSVDDMIKELTEYSEPGSGQRLSAAKLGIGIPFYGHVWSGGDELHCSHEPCPAKNKKHGAAHARQAWTEKQGKAPTYSNQQLDYAKLMTNPIGDRYSPQNAYWDYDAEASYIGIDAADSHADRFITYDDEGTVERKVRYAQANNLGGIMIWEIPAGYIPEQTSPSEPARQPLLDSVKAALASQKAPNVIIYATALSQEWQVAGIQGKLTPKATIKTPAVGTLPRGATALRVDTVKFEASVSFSHSGSNPLLHPGRFDRLSFSLYFPAGQSVADSVAITLENPWKSEFPQITLNAARLHPISAYPGWYTVELAMQELNPWGRLFNGVKLVNLTKSGRRQVFYINNMEIYGR